MCENSPSGATSKRRRRFTLRASALLIFVLLCRGGLSAYSVLTHEEIVDLLWGDEIRTLLLNRFPVSRTTRSKKRTPMLTEARSFRTSATTHSEAESSATWCITSAVATLFAS